MADSVIGLCNIALHSLGANSITSFSDGSAEAVLCNSMWDNARRSVLRAHPWNFAMKRAELAYETAPPIYDYSKLFPLPADCLRVIQVFNNQNYKLEANKILSNSETCFIKYVYDSNDIGSWDDNFKDLIAARLRFDLAYAITRSNSATQLAQQIYQEKLKLAKAVDASEDMTDPFGHFDNSFVAVRF